MSSISHSSSSGSGRVRQGRPRSHAAHEAILSAGVELVRERGYDAVTMDAIAARAGVGKATVYRRWKAKETLICEALERMMRELPAPDTGTLRGDLEALMREQLALYGDPATVELLSGLVAAMHRSEPLAAIIRRGFHAARRKAMVDVVQRWHRRGVLDRRLDLELFLDLFNGPLFYRFLFTGAALDRRYASALIDRLIAAFG